MKFFLIKHNMIYRKLYKMYSIGMIILIVYLYIAGDSKQVVLSFSSAMFMFGTSLFLTSTYAEDMVGELRCIFLLPIDRGVIVKYRFLIFFKNIAIITLCTFIVSIIFGIDILIFLNINFLNIAFLSAFFSISEVLRQKLCKKTFMIVNTIVISVGMATFMMYTLATQIGMMHNEINWNSFINTFIAVVFSSILNFICYKLSVKFIRTREL